VRVAVGVDPTTKVPTAVTVPTAVVVGTSTNAGTTDANAEEEGDLLPEGELLEEPLEEGLLVLLTLPDELFVPEGDLVEEGLPELLLVLDPLLELVKDPEALLVLVDVIVDVSVREEVLLEVGVRVGLAVIVLLELDVELRVGAELIVVEAEALAVSDIYDDELAEADGELVSLLLGVRVDVRVAVIVFVCIDVRVLLAELLGGLWPLAKGVLLGFGDLLELNDALAERVEVLVSVAFEEGADVSEGCGVFDKETDAVAVSELCGDLDIRGLPELVSLGIELAVAQDAVAEGEPLPEKLPAELTEG
jgi:hypothetical protein